MAVPDFPTWFLVPASTMNQAELRDRVAAYLASHHTMTVATLGPPDDRIAAASGIGRSEAAPHAASVFYVADRALRPVFMSKPSSVHGKHIGQAGPVAVTVSEDYGDWESIQGVQLWGRALLLTGGPRAKAMALYLTKFPFVREMMKQPRLAELIAGIGVYQVVPRRIAFTDNTTGVFGREVLEIER